MNKKYKFIEKRLFPEINKELWQIEALCDFGNVKKGDRGGWIENETNLSKSGNAWVRGNAWICDDAQIRDNAQIRDDAYVCGNAQVCETAYVCGNAQIRDDAEIITLGMLDNYARFITATWSKDDCVKVRAGDFFGTIDAFQKAVLEEYGDGESDYILIIPLLRKKEKEWQEARAKEKK